MIRYFIPSRLAPSLLALVSLACGPTEAPDTATESPSNANALTFDALRVEEISASRAVFRFTTSQPTECEAEFGTTRTELDQRATDPEMGDELSHDHEVPLEDLRPDTTYFVRARVDPSDSGPIYSDIISFATEAAAVGSNDSVAVANLVVVNVSSEWGGANGGFAAARAIDSSMATEWSSLGDGDAAWIEIGFGDSSAQNTLTEVAVSGFAFRSRKMADGTAIIRSLQVTIGETTVGPFNTPSPDESYRFAFDTPLVGSSARIDAVTTTGGNTGAKEISFFTSPSSTD